MSQPIERLGLAILLRDNGVCDFANLALMALRYMKQTDGWTPSPELLAQVDVLVRTRDAIRASTSKSASGHPRDDTLPDVASSDQIGSEDAARILGFIDARQVRRRAAELGGQQVAGRWVFDRDAVEAAAEARKHAHHV